MNVLMISPAFPAEMGHFTRGLARVGARVIGLGEAPESMLPPDVRAALAGYVQVDTLMDDEAVLDAVRRVARQHSLDAIECLWEPFMMLAAKLRQQLDLPGMRPAQMRLFRDKEAMKNQLDAAGIRTPRHRRATTEKEIRESVEAIGYPVIVKPIAGAGSADTYRVNDLAELDRTIPKVRHVRDLSVEEFIEGEEYTFDTICADGRIAYFNVAWYRPCPLIGRTVEWLSPQTVTLKRPDQPLLAAGVEMGRKVIDALGFQTGFTHMEWFRLRNGDAVFGEIAARPPGARSVELMNYACDLDTFTGWAEVVCTGRFTQEVVRRYNSAIVFKRARGQGRIQSIEGLERLIARYRQHVVCVDLLPVGSPRRNWKATLISDGYVIVRHQELAALLEMADRFGTDLELRAEP